MPEKFSHYLQKRPEQRKLDFPNIDDTKEANSTKRSKSTDSQYHPKPGSKRWQAYATHPQFAPSEEKTESWRQSRLKDLSNLRAQIAKAKEDSDLG